MKKFKFVVIVIALVSFYSGNVYSGFFGDVFSSMVANSLTSSNGKQYAYKEYDDNKKTQVTLKILDFYEYKLDGDLNTFDSREAIKKWQDMKNSGFLGFFRGIEKEGVLSTEEKQDLIYLGDLINKFALVKFTGNIESINKYLKRKKNILETTENFGDNYNISDIIGKMETEIDEFKDKKYPIYEKAFNLDKAKHFVNVKNNTIIWIPSTTNKVSWKEAPKICKTEHLNRKWSSTKIKVMRNNYDAHKWVYNNVGEYWCGTGTYRSGEPFAEHCTMSTRNSFYGSTDLINSYELTKGKRKHKSVACMADIF